LSGNQKVLKNQLSEVLDLDNSRKHKIQRLAIVCTGWTSHITQPQHEIAVDFGRPKESTTPATDKTTLVGVRVRSNDDRWANSALAEVEEQVERTFQRYTFSVLTLLGLNLLLLLFLLVAFPVRADEALLPLWLKASDLKWAESLVREPRIVTEQEAREVLTRQLRNVVAAERSWQAWREQATSFTDRRAVLLGWPVLFLVVCGVVLLTTCYPRAVFLWGDEKKRYKDMLRRRKFLWGLIWALLVGGIARLLFEGISPFVPRK